MYERKGYCLKCKNEGDYETCVACYAADFVGGVPSLFVPMNRSITNPESLPKSDPVNHPSHYETGKFECIEVMKEVFGVEAVQNFCLLNAFKYLYRCNHKNNKTEDIKKADWYINKYLELESEKHGKS